MGGQNPAQALHLAAPNVAAIGLKRRSAARSQARGIRSYEALDLPAFQRSGARQRTLREYLAMDQEPLAQSAPAPIDIEKDPTPPAESAEALLRRLARSQQLNGAWDEQVEKTAAALLALVRNGQTTQQGYLRKVVKRALGWLEHHLESGFPAWLRALALHELAMATGLSEHQAAADQALQALPEPQTEPEIAAWRRLQAETAASAPAKTPRVVVTLDDLRSLVVSNIRAESLEPGLYLDHPSEVIQIYLACLAHAK